MNPLRPLREIRTGISGNAGLGQYRFYDLLHNRPDARRRGRRPAREQPAGIDRDIREAGEPELPLRGVDRGDESVAQPAYRFYQAAAIHRWFVLRDLLPSHGIVLI